MNVGKYITIPVCLLLVACSNNSADNYREMFGLNRKGPDEFQVVARPALTVPPEFNLVAPKNGAEYAPSISAEDQAHNKVLGVGDNSQNANVLPTPTTPAAAGDSNTSGLFVSPPVRGVAAPVPAVSSGELPTSADSQFLSNAGANKANQNIRQTVTSDVDNGVVPKDNHYLLGGDKPDPEVDPAKEAERLKQDQSQNLPPTTGDTAVIPQDNSLFGKIFR